ncbi:MAG: RNA 2',3'-cyclic phosphodiesterase [Dehalococcoidia bacterium]
MTEKREHLRLFVACELPDDTRRDLGEIQQTLRREPIERVLRWVGPASIHLTLKFLGSVPAENVRSITDALAAAIEPFELHVRPARLGAFGGSRVRVVWVGLDGDVDGLAALAERVEGAVEPLGFARERRPFTGHVTLARVREQASVAERREVAALIRRTRMPELQSMALREVSLIESVLGGGGNEYRRLAAFP